MSDHSENANQCTQSVAQSWDVEIDALGLLCPLPVLKARKALMTMEVGQVLRLIATDPAAVIDVPHFCIESGHDFIASEVIETELGAGHAYLMRCV